MVAEYSIVSFCRPGQANIPVGILLLDRDNQQLRALFRHSWETAVGTDAPLFARIVDDLLDLAKEIGATRLMEIFEDSLSNSIQVTDRKHVESSNLDATLHKLFKDYIDQPSCQEL
jgi:hypothetical protein